ncbi:MAG: DUF3857 domain-containing transglutaminase family protein [Bacteroidota bacterium]
MKQLPTVISAISLMMLLGSFSHLPAQSYSALLISDEMKKDAHGVIRSYVKEIHVKDERRAELYEERIITIFNQKAARELGELVVSYDDFDKIGEMEAEIYDQLGNRIRKLKSKEIEDMSATGSSFATDLRVKVATLYHNVFPYTIRFSYRKTIKGLFALPHWIPQNYTSLSVESASLKVVAPSELEIRYKGLNVGEGPDISDKDGMKQYEWHVSDLTATKMEPYGPPSREFLPMVYLAPGRFEIEGYKGSSKSWKDFGMFYHQLNLGRDKLPAELASTVRELTQDLSTPEEKIQKLYSYMQENTRYVSIQLGIGGWQSFDANYVYKNGYGDCKALSNYVKSMLAAIDITAYPVLIKAGDYATDILPDFSGNQFNHAILCVPNEGDSMWLECTVNNFPAGYLGQFTADRYALIVTPKGGKLVRTPASLPETNRQNRLAKVVLDKSGNAQVQVSVETSGFQQDNLTEFIDGRSERERETWLRKSIHAKSFDITQYQFEGTKMTRIPTYRFQYELDARNWAAASGSRFFLAPNQLERYDQVPKAVKDRTQPVVTRYPYLDTDTIEYQLPDGYILESMPEMPIKLESEFGTYIANIDFKPEKGVLIYTRHLMMRKTRRPAEEYKDYRQFMRDIVKADKIQVVLSGRT